MTDPILFDSVSPRFGLPLLFAGQSQKEVYVNEALALADALLHCAIEGEAATPPVTPTEGTNWLVAAEASGEWSGHGGALACRQGGAWLFVSPRDGMSLLNRATGQTKRYWGGWQIASNVAPPAGGSTIDNEARSAILQIIAALRAGGVLASA